MAALLIAFGIALRLAGYFAHRSFWGDEVAVALNLRLRSIWGLFHTLDYEQTVPIGLLLTIKSVLSALGNSEYVLRLPLLIAGCSTLAALWWVIKRISGAAVALIALAITAIFRPLIYYSSELKQYGLDALITTIIVGVAFGALRSGSPRRWWILTLWGVIALLFSQPAIFVLAGVVLLAAVDRRFWKSRSWRNQTLLAMLVWLCTFFALYFLCYRAVSHSLYMRAFWAANFLYPRAPGFLAHLRDAVYVLLAAQYFDHVRAVVLALLFAVGVYAMVRKHGALAVLLVFPFATVLMAAMLQQYPIAPRLVLFTVPLLFWIYAAGVVAIAQFGPAKLRNLSAGVLAIAFIVPTAVSGARYAVHFPQREANRQLIAFINQTDRSAAVYVAFDEYLQWAYYAGDWSHPQLLKQRIDAAFHTDRKIEFAPSDQGRIEIVGQFPPGNKAESDAEWAQEQGARILALHRPAVWLFVPIYVNEAALGHNLQDRHVLEKLQDELATAGAHIITSKSVGDSLAIEYALPT